MLKKLPSILKTSIMTPVTYVLIASCLVVPDIMGNNIMLDGTLSPEEWNQASSYDLEYEVMPSRNTPAALKTTAYMKYDKKYLYIGIKAFGDPNKIRATLKNRDQTWNEDYVALMADPFRDGRYGVLIGVNALGVQLDEKHISSAGPDDSWNILFQSATAFQDDGYSAEFMIPFSELQLPDTEIQQWKIGFIRKSYQAGVQTVFASFKNLPAETCYACQADEEVLLGSPDEIYRSYLYPYIFINQFGNRPVKKFKVQNPDYEIGITGLYDLTRSSSIEYTINPDFSQIESDAPVIMENQTFALSYPEKRTFFLEGSELLKSDTQTVYTRSITNPLGAIKYTNQGENNSIYFLQATDTDSPYLAAGQYRSFLGNAGKSKVTIGRFKKNLGNKSHIGLIATNRDYQIGGSGSVVEFDSLINFLDDYILDLNYAKSDTQEGQIDFIGSEDTFAGRTYAMDGESFSGVAKNFRLRRAVDQSNWGVRFKDVSPTYRAHVGFVGRNDYKSRNYWYGRTYRSTGTIRRKSTAINRGVAAGVRESNYLLSQVRAGPTPTPSSSNFSVTPDVPNGILISLGTNPATAKTDTKLTWTGSGLNIAGHLNYTGLVADSTDIANNTDALQMPWSNTGKTFKCLCTGSVSKVITFAEATPADIGKKIKIIQTAKLDANLTTI